MCRTYTEGERVHYTTSDAEATVVRFRPYGDIVILVDGASLPLDTRECFLRKLDRMLEVDCEFAAHECEAAGAEVPAWIADAILAATKPQSVPMPRQADTLSGRGFFRGTDGVVRRDH